MQGAHFACNNAGSVREASTAGYKTEFALQALVIAAIYAAIALNQTFSCTQSCTGYSQQDIGNVMRALVADGFTVSYANAVLTISW